MWRPTRKLVPRSAALQPTAWAGLRGNPPAAQAGYSCRNYRGPAGAPHGNSGRSSGRLSLERPGPSGGCVVAGGPFEFVEQRLGEVPGERHTAADCAAARRQVLLEVSRLLGFGRLRAARSGGRLVS